MKREDRSYKIVCFGDSTTDDTLIPIEGYEGSYKDLMVYSEFLDDQLPKVSGKPVEIINSGVSGDTTNDARFRFQSDVLSHNPDLVIIQFGVNDQVIRQDIGLTKAVVSSTKFAYEILFFIQRIRRQGGKVMLMTPGLLRWRDHFTKRFFRAPYKLNDPFGMNGNLLFYVEQVEIIARTEDVLLVDIYQEEKKFDAGEGQSIDDLLPDGVHPNTEGHKLIAERIIEKICEAKPEII